MGNLTFPLRGERLEVRQAFATEAQLVSLGPESWLSCMAEYASRSGNLTLVAPTTGFIRVIQKPTSSDTVTIPLIEFRAQSANFVYRVPQWRMPLPNRFVFSSSVLDAEPFQLEVLRRALQAEADRRTRARTRYCMATFDGDLPAGCTDLLISRTVTDDEVRTVQRLHAPVVVRQGQVLAELNSQARVGMAYVQEFRDANQRWYWLDSHEIFKRIKEADPRDSDLHFPFTEDPAGGIFKIWYENRDRLPIAGSVQITRMEGGLQNSAIYQPPVENATDREREDALREYVPGELCLPMEGHPVRIFFSGTSLSFQLRLLNELGADSVIHTSREFRPTAADGGGRSEILRSTHGYSFPDDRLEPYLVELRAGDRSLSYSLQNSRMQRVNELAIALLDQKLSMVDWLRAEGRPEQVQMFNKIELFLDQAGAASGDLRARLNTSRYDTFLSDYRGRQHSLNQAVDALTAALDAAFVNELQAEPSEANLTILSRAVDALSDTERGDVFMEEQFRGFLLPELRTSGEPLIPLEFITGVWNSAMQFRSKAVEALVQFAKIDMYLAIRELYTVPMTVDRTARLGALVRRFEERFGEMHHLRITTGEFEVAGMRMQNFHFEWDTAALDDADLPDQRHHDRTRAGQATAAANTLNTINLLSSIWSIFAQGLEIYHRSDRDLSWSDLYDFTENLVGVADAVADLLPTRTTIAARPGWGAISGGVGLVFSAVSMSKVLQDALGARRRGDYQMSSWLAISAAGSAVSLGAGSLVFLGAASGPLAPVIITGSLIALWAGIVAGSTAASGLELDLDHCYFGQHYNGLVSRYNDLDAIYKDPDHLGWLVARDQYFPWVNDLIGQLGYLNNHIFPLGARLRVDEIDDPSSPGTGARLTRVRLDTDRSYCVQHSRVFFILFADSTPDQHTMGSFVLSPACFTTTVAKGAEPGEGPSFAYRADRHPQGRISVHITLYFPVGTVFDNVDRAMVSITHRESIEYTPRITEYLRQVSGLDEFSPGFSASVIDMIRTHPYNLHFAESAMQFTANKSTAFLPSPTS